MASVEKRERLIHNASIFHIQTDPDYMKTANIVNESQTKPCWKHTNIKTQTQSNSYQSLFVLRNFAQQFFSFLLCVCFSRSIWISHAIIPAGAAETDLLHKVLLSTIASLGFFFFRFFFFFLFFFFAIEKWKDGGGQKIPMAHEKSEGKGRSVKKRGGKGQKEQR